MGPFYELFLLFYRVCLMTSISRKLFSLGGSQASNVLTTTKLKICGNVCFLIIVRCFNTNRVSITCLRLSGEGMLDELTMERVMEALERKCHDNMNHAIETEEGLGIEYDEDVICDVCRSPDSEEGNDMVFCDKCNICVHQVSRTLGTRMASGHDCLVGHVRPFKTCSMFPGLLWHRESSRWKLALQNLRAWHQPPVCFVS